MDSLLYRFFKKEVPLKFVGFKRGNGKAEGFVFARENIKRAERRQDASSLSSFVI